MLWTAGCSSNKRRYPRNILLFLHENRLWVPIRNASAWDFTQTIAVAYILMLLICIQNRQIHTSISYPQVATRNTAAKIFLTALHFASDVSALIRTPLNQEQENWLTTSANGVIRNRKFHLPLREHGNKREKTYFLTGLNPSQTFSPSCWHITQTCQKWGK